MPVPAQPPLDEQRRLAALAALNLLDTPPERDYDAIVALAAQLLDMPNAFISLVDRQRQWLKAKVDPALPAEFQRDIAFCDTTIRSRDMLVIDDLALDPRFCDNPFVVDDGIRFYAGVPIHVTDDTGASQPVGTLCVIDERPRTLSAEARQALRHLAGLAEALIAARADTARAASIATLAARQATDLARSDRTFRQAERMAMIGSWRYDPVDGGIEWSDGVFRIHGLPVGTEPAVDRAMDFYPPHARAEISAAMATAIQTGKAFDVETDFVTATGDRRRVRSLGEPEHSGGRMVALVGVFQDVTDRYELEQQLRRSADRDELTGIANRAAFNRTLADAVADAIREGTPLMLALIDLDGFKAVNDTLGHLAGDDVLRTVARRIEQPWLTDCIAARLGGDEFALIVTDPALIEARVDFVARLEDTLQLPVSAGGLTIAASGTVGTALLGAHATIRDLVHAADTDLYAAKRRRIGERRIGDRRRAA